MMPWQALPPGSSSTPGVQEPAQYQLSQQQTVPQPAVPAPFSPDSTVNPPTPFTKRRYTSIIAIAVILALSITLYFIWRSPTTTTTPSSISQQNFSSTSSNSNGSTTAQKIVNYRTQHGPFTSIDQLLQVISKSEYNQIMGLVTI